ncbi:MAG: 4-oxalocrotonate decarboxylase [Gordonia paraffinivorans]
MPTTTADVDDIARRLDDAQRDSADVESLADEVDIDVDTAYAIQEALVARRCERGERLTGVKLGFTSLAKMRQMGVSEVIVGRLTDAMAVADGGDLDLGRFIHPKVEPEVAYRIGVDVDPDGPAPDVRACVDAVAPAMEIIDSRYRDFRFTYTDVIADNTSAAAYVVGEWRSPRAVSDRAVHLTAGDVVVDGSTAAILDDPINAIVRLLELARRRRIPLRAGDVVLAGAATAAVPLVSGEARCVVDGLGSVTIRVNP